MLQLHNSLSSMFNCMLWQLCAYDMDTFQNHLSFGFKKDPVAFGLPCSGATNRPGISSTSANCPDVSSKISSFVTTDTAGKCQDFLFKNIQWLSRTVVSQWSLVWKISCLAVSPPPSPAPPDMKDKESQHLYMYSDCYDILHVMY